MNRYKTVELNMDNPDFSIKTKPWGIYDSETNTLRPDIFNYDYEADNAIQHIDEMDEIDKDTKYIRPHSEKPDNKR